MCTKNRIVVAVVLMVPLAAVECWAVRDHSRSHDERTERIEDVVSLLVCGTSLACRRSAKIPSYLVRTPRPPAPEPFRTAG